MSLLKGFKIISLVLIIGIMLTGCMNSTHIKDLSVVEGLGIDKYDDNISVIAQTLNIEKTAGSDSSSQGNVTINTQGNGKTIVDAIASLSTKLSKKLFLGQNKLIVFSRDISEKDFKSQLDYFMRSADSRSDVAVCISSGSAKEIVECKQNDSKVPCETIVHLINNGEKEGLSAYVTTGELLSYYADKTSDMFLPVLKVQNENVELGGIGVFSGDNLSYVLNDEETMGFLFVSGRIKYCTLEFEDEELGKIGIGVSDIKAKNSTEVKDGKIIFKSDIKAKLIINEIEKGLTTTLTKEKLDHITSLAEKELSSLCTKAFIACQNNDSDCMRVGDYLAKCEPSAYESTCEKWKDYYRSAQFSPAVECQLKKVSNNTQVQ